MLYRPYIIDQEIIRKKYVMKICISARIVYFPAYLLMIKEEKQGGTV